MYRVKLPRAYPDWVRRCAVEDQLPLLQDACNNVARKPNYYGMISLRDERQCGLRETLEIVIVIFDCYKRYKF